MPSTLKADRNAVQQAYATDEGLLTRQRIHDMYTVPRMNFADWVLNRVQWEGHEQVLDLGAGTGGYFDLVQARIPRGTLYAGDLSMGMARRAQATSVRGRVSNMDAENLPFANNTFDVVLANHILFHVPNLDRALSEIHRVLKPTGLLVASTNSVENNMAELQQLYRRCYALLGVRGTEIDRALIPDGAHFYLEDGPRRASRHFFAVVRYDLPSLLVLPSAQPLVDYVNSLRPLREKELPKGVTWEDFINVLADQVRRLIGHFGELAIGKLAGVIIATDEGGFSRQYVQKLRADESGA
ncbi:MAG: class I SAM-dependent methyltransferase [Anaerolineae bacterium]